MLPGVRPAHPVLTQRGFAVVDVNYRGSSGFGRAYRQRLREQWGVVDVEDACQAARALAQQGAIDPQRVFIRGSSAGGYTALSALVATDLFRGGASLYGVSDPWRCAGSPTSSKATIWIG